jgi:integrase
VVVRFTARTVASLRPNGRRAEYVDADCPGLSLRVTSAGVKTWVVRYRHRGRSRRLTLARADVLPLAKARDRARDALRDASNGKDPALVKQQDRTATTIGALATDYIERYAKAHKKSWDQDERALNAEVLPHWKHRAVADITRRDVRQLVQAIADRGSPITANRIVALLSRLFLYAVDEEIIESSPAVRIPKPAREQSRERVLTEEELRTFWKGTQGFDLPLRAWWRLRLITLQRGGEVTSMEWADVDLTSATWTIPSAKAKNALGHRVPLNAMALSVLKELQDRRDAILAAREKRGDDESAPITHVLDGALGKRQHRVSAKDLGLSAFRGHDLRRTGATLMTSGGVSRLTVAKLLNHADGSVTAIYDRASYDVEKRAAMDWWAERLTCITSKL